MCMPAGARVANRSQHLAVSTIMRVAGARTEMCRICLSISCIGVLLASKAAWFKITWSYDRFRRHTTYKMADVNTKGERSWAYAMHHPSAVDCMPNV